jgi:hypothetical protein
MAFLLSGKGEMTDKARDVFLEIGHQRPLFQKQLCSLGALATCDLRNNS